MQCKLCNSGRFMGEWPGTACLGNYWLYICGFDNNDNQHDQCQWQWQCQSKHANANQPDHWPGPLPIMTLNMTRMVLSITMTTNLQPSDQVPSANPALLLSPPARCQGTIKDWHREDYFTIYMKNHRHTEERLCNKSSLLLNWTRFELTPGSSFFSLVHISRQTFWSEGSANT